MPTVAMPTTTVATSSIIPLTSVATHVAMPTTSASSVSFTPLTGVATLNVGGSNQTSSQTETARLTSNMQELHERVGTMSSGIDKLNTNIVELTAAIKAMTKEMQAARAAAAAQATAAGVADPANTPVPAGGN